MSFTLEVYADDLTTLIAELSGVTGLGWSHAVEDYGEARFTVPHDHPTLVANPTILDGENLVKILDGGTERMAWLIRNRKRVAAPGADEVEVVGPDALALLARALVYPHHGLNLLLQDFRLFAWQSLDYDKGAGWGTPTGLGTYANPTDSQLAPAPGDPAVNEVQTVELNADTSGFPWGGGTTYPSPGGLPGTWTLEHRGKETADLVHTANAAAIKAALEALPHIDGVTVVGDATGSFTVEFDGASVAGKQQELLVLHHSQLRHGSSGVTRTTEGTKQVEGAELVEGWPDPDAVWLGGFGQDAYYRRVLDVEAASKSGPCRLYVVSLGPVSVWLDGDHLGDGDNLDLLEYDLELYDLDHVVAIQAEAPTMWTIVEVDEEGEPGYALYRGADYSGEPFDLEVYGPDAPPGVTPGFMLSTLFDEATARGYLPPVTYDFTDTVDSFGNAWTVDVELGLQVGNDSVLSVAERLRDLGVRFRMTPGLVFQAWEGVLVDRGGTPDGGASTVTFQRDHCTNLQLQTEDEEVTALLMRLVDLWVERHVAGPRREAFLSLGTVPTAAGAIRIADAIIDDLSAEREAYTWSTDEVSPAPQMYVDLEVGDVVQGPTLANMTADWTAGDLEIVKATATVDAAGDVSWTWEAGTP